MEVHKKLYKDPLVKCLIELDETLSTSSEASARPEAFFRQLFDKLVKKYSPDSMLANQIKHELITEARKKKITHINGCNRVVLLNHDEPMPTEKQMDQSTIYLTKHNDKEIEAKWFEYGKVKTTILTENCDDITHLFETAKKNIFTIKSETELFNYTALICGYTHASPLQKISVLYQENTNINTIKYNFLSALYSRIKDDRTIDQAVRERESISIEKKAGYLGLLDKENTEPKKIDKRFTNNLCEYMNCGVEKIDLTFENIVLDAILFAAQADASEKLQKIMIIISDPDDLTANSRESAPYEKYINTRKVSAGPLVYDLCIEAFQEVCGNNIQMQFNEDTSTINGDFIHRLDKITKRYSPYENITFTRYDRENAKLTSLLDDEDSVLTPKIRKQGKELQSYLNALKNVPANCLSERSFTKDLIVINRALNHPHKKNIKRLLHRAAVHQTAGAAQVVLGGMMIALGIGLMVMAGLIIAGTCGAGIPAVACAAMAIGGAFSALGGLGFFGKGSQREKAAKEEKKMGRVLAKYKVAAEI